METLGVGMVGYGFMGKMHTYAYRSLPMLYEPAPANIRLVGAAVRSPESQMLAVEQGGYSFATTRYSDLIERDDIDIINCCVPNELHREVVLQAIEAGKHIYVEKPLAANLKEANEMLLAEEAAEGQGLHRARQMAHNYRFIPALLRAKELIGEGRLGRVFTFSLRFLHSSNTDPRKPLHWKSDWTKGGGVLADLGSHIIDLSRWLLGDFRRIFSHPVTAFNRRPGPDGAMEKVEGDDACFLVAELATGAVGTLEASKLAVGSNDELTIDIRGEKGALTFNLMEPNWLHFYDNTLPDEPLGGSKGFTRIESVHRYPSPAALPGPKVSIGWMRFHIASIHEFVRRAAEGEPGEPSLADGLAVQQVLETAYSSPGRWVDVIR